MFRAKVLQKSKRQQCLITSKIVHKSLKKSCRNSFFNEIYLLLLQYV